MLSAIMISACASMALSNPTLNRDVRRWSLDLQEQRCDLRDLRSRIDILDARVTEQLNRRIYGSGVRNVK